MNSASRSSSISASSSRTTVRPSGSSSSRKSYSGSGWNSLALRRGRTKTFFRLVLGVPLDRSLALGTFRPISTATRSPRLNSTSSAQSTVPICSPASHPASSLFVRAKSFRTRSPPPLQLVPALRGLCVLEPNNGPASDGKLGLRESLYLDAPAIGGRYPSSPSSERLSPAPRSTPLLPDPRSPRLPPPVIRSIRLTLWSGRLRSSRLPPHGRRKRVSRDRLTLRLREVGAMLGVEGDVGWLFGGFVDAQSRRMAAAAVYTFWVRYMLNPKQSPNTYLP
jgi:hypothetical protein